MDGGVSERKSEGERGVHVNEGVSMSGTLRASETSIVGCSATKRGKKDVRKRRL